ncbi:hypothetical protein, partial [Acidiphilium sp.]|uniref:hypothetical protein n=1 Tax=Acidiphilium sp. TaxID=527 RepID=UPI00258F2687
MKNLCPPTQTFSQARQPSGIRQINGMETALTHLQGLLPKMVLALTIRPLIERARLPGFPQDLPAQVAPAV